MKNKGNIYIHFIEEDCVHVLKKTLVSSVPRTGEEIRIGGESNEQFYTVTQVVWIYDEPDNPFERVNVGVKLST